MNNDYKYVPILRFEKLLKKLFQIIQLDGFICGGFARVSITQNDNFIQCSDIDIYCKNIEAFERIKERFLAKDYSISRESDIAISMKRAFVGQLPVQLIKPINQGHIMVTSDNIHEILDNFDFTIARAGVIIEKVGTESEFNTENDLYINLDNNNYIFRGICDKDFFVDDKDKSLNIKNIHCPVAQVYRVSKYLKKGYNIRTLQIVKILQDWEDRPTDYKNKLLEKLSNENPTQEEIDELEKLLHID